MIKWPKCSDNGGPKECLGHIEQHSDGRSYCDECHTEFRIAVGDHIIFDIDVKDEDDKRSLFSGMCAEEIQEVAIKLHADDVLDYTRHEKMLLMLIANLAAIFKEKDRPVMTKQMFEHLIKYHEEKP